MKHRNESGFAMLLVFVMAAAISITLYMEVPRIAFESQRAKEQMAIDRGLQYKRAIQLFYRKYQVYPQTLDDLETSRNIRFLRRRYLDPLTGKPWRLLHVGPAGQLTDSLVQPPAPLPGSSTGSGPNAGPGSQQTGGFGQSSNPGQTSNSAPAPNATQPVDPNNPNDPNAQAPDPLNMAARRPSDRIIGRGNGGGGGVPLIESAAEPVVEQPPPPEPEPEQPQPAPVETLQQPADPNAPQDPTQPENPAQPQNPGQSPIPGLPAGVQPPGQPPGQPAAPSPVPFPPLAPPGQTQPTGQPQFPGQQFPGQPGAPANGGQPQSAANMIQNILTTPRQPPSSLNFTSGNTGGIAGVASTAEGKGIHVVNDHAKYKEWEFVYDLKKDKNVVGAGAVNQQQQIQQQMQQNQNGANGPFGSSGNNSSPFNSTPTSSPSGSNPGAPAAPTTAPPSQ